MPDALAHVLPGRTARRIRVRFGQSPLKTSIQADIHRLGVLTGRLPTALAPELVAPAPIPPPPAEIAIGDPASLLRRRPDIRAAERNLASATAQIGVAELH